MKTGSLKFIGADDETCVGTVYDAGESFVDRGGDVHIARASATAGVGLWATYFVPAGSTTFRLDEPDPGTGC